MLSLLRAATSAHSENREIGVTGPKTSCRIRPMSSVTSTTTPGLIQWPSPYAAPDSRSPPVSTVAPACTEADRMPRVLSSSWPLTFGPICVSRRVGSPTLSAHTAATYRSTNSG